MTENWNIWDCKISLSQPVTFSRFYQWLQRNITVSFWCNFGNYCTMLSMNHHGNICWITVDYSSFGGQRWHKTEKQPTSHTRLKTIRSFNTKKLRSILSKAENSKLSKDERDNQW